MSKDIRVAVIGAGAISTNHVKGLRAAGCTVVAVADPLPAARARAAKELDVPTCDSLDEVLSTLKPDAVTIATPNATHATLAIRALKAGLPVLCEKPPATCLAEAKAMRAAATSSGRLLMMGFNQRFEPEAQQLARLRDQGVFGDIYHAKCAWIRRRGIPGMGGWFTTKALAGGGPVYDLGIHVIDRTWFVMGRPKPVSVSAAVYAKFGDLEKYVCESMWAGPRKRDGICDIEDFAAAFIRFDNGATLQFEISWAANRPDEDSRTLIMGDKAGAVWTGSPARLYGELNGTLATTDITFDRSQFPDRFAHFAACLRGEAKCTCTGDDGVAIQAILDAIYQSAAERREVAVGDLS